MTTAPISDDWLDHAWCKRSGQGDRWIYPDGRNPPADRTPQHAQQRCAPCPVLEACAKYTLQRTLPYDMIQAGKAWGRTEIERLHTAKELADEHQLPAPTNVTNNHDTTPDTSHADNRGRCTLCTRFLVTSPRFGHGEARSGGRGMCSRCYKRTLRDEERARQPNAPHPGLPESIIQDNTARSRERQERIEAAGVIFTEAGNDYAATRAELIRRYGCSKTTARKYIMYARRNLNQEATCPAEPA